MCLWNRCVHAFFCFGGVLIITGLDKQIHNGRENPRGNWVFYLPTLEVPTPAAGFYEKYISLSLAILLLSSFLLTFPSFLYDFQLHFIKRINPTTRKRMPRCYWINLRLSYSI